MYQYYKQEHDSCKYNMSDNEIGFRIATPKQGEIYKGTKPKHNSIVFILEGEVEFSYGEYLFQQLGKGDIFLLPQSFEMYSKALTDCKIMILSFDNEIESLCDNCTLSDYKKSDADMEYVFGPLKITQTIRYFCELMEEYLQMDIRCSYIHQLKQRELFLLFRYSYSRVQMIQFFLPLIGEHVSFKNKVFKFYNQGVGVKELAGRFNMSETPFVAKFKSEFNDTPYQWVLKQKRKHIMLRLSIPETTISDIVSEFKFTDAAHFLKYCKKHFGCTPNELLKQIKESRAIKQ